MTSRKPKPARAAKVSGRILLVDDDSSVRESLATVLVGEGYEVMGAGDGAQALQIAMSRTVDLVLLDLSMPGQDGWATLEVLSREHPSLPIALVTGRSNQLFPALAAGVAALLEKPVDIPHLLQTVRRVLAEPVGMHTSRPESFYYIKCPRGRDHAH